MICRIHVNGTHSRKAYDDTVIAKCAVLQLVFVCRRGGDRRGGRNCDGRIGGGGGGNFGVHCTRPEVPDVVLAWELEGTHLVRLGILQSARIVPTVEIDVISG